MNNFTEVDASLINSVMGFVSHVSPQMQDVSRYVVSSGLDRSPAQQQFVGCFTGLFTEFLFETIGIDSTIGHEIGAQLEIVHLLHNFRLDLPWDVAGNITARPSSIFAPSSLATFGYEIQARLGERMLSIGSGELSAESILKINYLLNHLMLGLAGKRNQILSAAYIAGSGFEDLLKTSFSVTSTLDQNQSKYLTDELRDLIPVIANIRRASVALRVVKQLNQTDQIEPVNLKYEELAEFGLFSIPEVSSKYTKSKETPLELRYLLRHGLIEDLQANLDSQKNSFKIPSNIDWDIGAKSTLTRLVEYA